MRFRTENPLHFEHAKHLAGFLISPEILDLAGIRSVADVEAREMLGLHGHNDTDLGGILFPYNHPLTGERVGARIRLDHAQYDGGKYISEPGNRHLYFAPCPKEWLADTSITVILAESEKAALALFAFASRSEKKLVLIGLGGCWGWRRKTGNQPLPNGGHERLTGPSPSFQLVSWQGRKVIILFDSNATSNSHVKAARRRLAEELTGRDARVYIGHVPCEPGINGPDDLIALAGDEAVLRVLDAVQKFDECAVSEAEQALTEIEANKKIDPLLAMEAIAAIGNIERRTLLIGRLVALKIPGANRKFVDQQVGNHRAEAEADRQKAVDACRQGHLMAMDVNGAALLREVCAWVRRFVVLSEAQARIVALWIVHTHVFDAADSTPYQSVTSPQKRSGKSRLLEVCEILVARPWLTGRITAAVLYRKVDAESPTLLLDESDAAFKSGDEYSEVLRGILNTGHRRGGTASCCVGKGADLSYRDFSTFSPKMIAGIGELPDTVADRSIPIRLQRKTRDEKVQRFRKRDAGKEGNEVREQLEAWAAQNSERLVGARPELPEELSDRQQDGAEPLLAIADLAGGEWPEAARRALVLLCCGAPVADDSVATLLLTDIRQIFNTRGVDRLRSVELCSELAEKETSPWGEWNHGKPITPSTLAKLLRAFEIAPHNIRLGEETPKGYERIDFEEAWTRYVSSPDSDSGTSPGPEPATPPQAPADASSSEFSKRHENEIAEAHLGEKLKQDARRGGVAAAESPSANTRHKPRPREEL